MSPPADCPRCDGAVPAGAATCPGCGADLTACVHCGAVLLTVDRFCAECGSRQSVPPGSLSQAPTSAPAVPTSWNAVLERLREATAGEFEVEREIGRGGMAAVYLAHEAALRRRVAIKVMSPELMLGEGMVERFRQEAQTIARLHHPNIVTVHAIRERAGLCFIVMAFVDGTSLEVLLRNGPLPIPLVRSVLAQVGAALDYAHRNGVVHRDVKPGNILIDADGQCAVSDFGIAKVAEAATITNPGEPLGTPAYMSPEQCDGRPATPAADQYSLGVTAYEMVTGSRPFTGSPLTVMRGHVERPPPPIAPVRPDCPRDLLAAIERMLAKQPEHRFPTVAAAVAAGGARALAPGDALRALLRDVAGSPAAVRTEPSGPTPSLPELESTAELESAPGGLPRRHRPPRGALVAGGVLAVVAAAAWLALRQPAAETVAPPAPAPLRLDLPPGGDLVAAVAAIGPGGTIALDTGAYLLDRRLVIDKAVRIEGRGRDSTRITIAVPDTAIMVTYLGSPFELVALEVGYPAPSTGPAVSVDAFTARLLDTRFRGAGVTDDDCRGMGIAVRIASGSRALVGRSELGGFCTGIQVVDSAMPEISGNRLAGNATGIRYMDQAAGGAYANTVEDNGEGIVLNSGSPTIEQNTITRNRIFGVFVDPRAAPRGLPRNRIVNNLQNIEQSRP